MNDIYIDTQKTMIEVWCVQLQSRPRYDKNNWSEKKKNTSVPQNVFFPSEIGGVSHTLLLSHMWIKDQN